MDTQSIPQTGDASKPTRSAAEMKELIYPNKPIPYTIDAGHLLLSDANPLPSLSPSSIEPTLQSAARDCAQSLIGHLLQNCPIVRDDTGVSLTLPTPQYQLPREKPIPKEKEKTKWEAFAERKGIQKRRKDERSKMVWDEVSHDWVKRYGFGGKAMREKQLQWVVEVDEKEERRKVAEEEAEKRKPRGSGPTRPGKAERSGQVFKRKNGKKG
ncbi:RRS1-domain-containing protein [Eremomyces bilateralis CBS 781.70]|uniref:Ribosome biogenesis regulatory protein n=1 Tax=Eremomyces bilateralis CBS 781.70 TaxID=1392243 RepID=A0A6G1GBK5_9PEZI|nr:RRS1-domain-containing protein [Eremomyces bilateralis CBS 781.70]KAF1815394.1 RRS1-domain-containing protein [Eremomyces bilateralis CBS 781.70]